MAPYQFPVIASNKKTCLWETRWCFYIDTIFSSSFLDCFIPFRAKGGCACCYGWSLGAPLNESPAHCTAQCEHLGTRYLAQGYVVCFSIIYLFLISSIHGLLKLNLVSFWHVPQSSIAPHVHCRSYDRHISRWLASVCASPWVLQTVIFREQLFCQWDGLVPVIMLLNKGMEANCWAVTQSSFSLHQNIHYEFSSFLFITFGLCSWNKKSCPFMGEKGGTDSCVGLVTPMEILKWAQ